MSNFEAMYYEAIKEDFLRCLLCPHYCEIPQSSSGKCGVRKNLKGKLIADSYSKVNGIALDPIEKKPLHFFYPGSMILSVGTYGCNLDCPFCQNYKSVRKHLSSDGHSDEISPTVLLELAKKYITHGNIGVAYTYNEPMVGYEYVYESAKLIKNAGFKNILVTNGFINPHPLQELLPYVDAMNIDLKAFSPGFYEKLGANLEAVKDTIANAAKNCHIEVTILIIPGENEFDIIDAAKWIASINESIPLHLSRFFPRYKYANYSPTPLETLQNAAKQAKRYLQNVVLGNI